MKCLNCKKEFSYKLVGSAYLERKEKEDIICPHCNYTCGSILTSQTVESIKNEEGMNVLKSPKDLLTEQEIEFIDTMTEGELAEHLAVNYSDY